MRRLTLLLAALAALPLCLYAAPAAAQSAANAQAAAAATSAAIGAITTTPPASQRPRAIQQFTTGWRFLQADAAGAEKVAFDDSAWKSVTLPHDWSIAGPAKEDAPSKGAGAFMPTGVGWYRKSFTVPAADAKPAAARRTFIVFDGVMANSDVYLNGELLGHRPYGYVSFVYELTPHLRAGKNVIAVRVDDSQQPASRWYPGAGINRQVRLITTGDAHIVPWGTFVTTPAVMADSATIHIRSTVTNESAAAAKLSLRVQLTAPNGSAVLAGKVAQLDAAAGPRARRDRGPERRDHNRQSRPLGHWPRRDVYRPRHAAARRQAGGRGGLFRSAFASSTSTPTRDSSSMECTTRCWAWRCTPTAARWARRSRWRCGSGG